LTLKRITEKAKSSEQFGGLSPSGLITFKECSLKFYYRYGVGLKEIKEVEESAEANTFGSILHLALENLYRPFVNRVLHEDDFKKMDSAYEKCVEVAFSSFFPDSSQLMGKNYLQVEVLKVYVKRLLDLDKENVKELKKQNKHLTILYLENEWKASLPVNIDGQEEIIFVNGKIDRIDKCGDKIRVIDYKNSIKLSDKFTFTNFDDLLEHTEYNKQLQLFTYVWLLSKNKPDYLKDVLPGIIPFKKFTKTPKHILANAKEKEPLVFTTDLMRDFETRLASFIEGIMDKTVPFSQTEDLDICEYCGYKTICNR